ncbi:hypothetical protein EIQ00_13965 [Xanthomonas campestris pv. raphani]
MNVCAPTIATGLCPPTVAGPLAAWVPPRRLQRRTCGVRCDGGRAGPCNRVIVQCAAKNHCQNFLQWMHRSTR